MHTKKEDYLISKLEECRYNNIPHVFYTSFAQAGGAILLLKTTFKQAAKDIILTVD